MKKEEKQKLINEIVGILHKDAGTMYDKGPCGELSEDYIALTEDYFEDVAESIFNYINNRLSQLIRKNNSNNKQDIIDYIFEFAWEYSRSCKKNNLKNGDDILNDVCERCQLPKDFLKKYIINKQQ